MKKERWYRVKLRNYLQSVMYGNSPEACAEDTTRALRNFSGWQFRLYQATGGTIVECLYNGEMKNQVPSSRYGNSTSTQPEPELHIIPNDMDVTEELPKIMTMVMMKTG